MSIRVNMMQQGEFRRQGAVSGAFIVRMTIATTIGVVLLIGGLMFMSAQTERRDLAASQEIWEMREPYYDRIQSMKEDLAKEKSLIAELDGWKRGRIVWHEQLFALQKLVPAPMQLKRLNIRADLDFEKPAAPVETAAPAGEGGGKKKKAKEPSVGTPLRVFFMNFEGLATGRQAEDLVVQFIRILDSSEAYSGMLEEIKLHRLQRETSASASLNDRRFVIEAKTAKMRVK